MEIALIIVAGLALMTFIAGGFDYLNKRKLKVSKETENRVLALEQKVQQMEAELSLKNARLEQMDESLSFLNKLIEDKTKR